MWLPFPSTAAKPQQANSSCEPGNARESCSPAVPAVLLRCRWGNNGGRRWKGGRGPTASINFVVAHDGFTLADLVSYNEKKNLANGEDNRHVEE